jgi:hypothetical protein
MHSIRPFRSLRISVYLALLTVSSLGMAQSNATLQLPTASDPCRFGSKVLPTPPKMFTRIMPSRYSDLNDVMEGYQRSGVPLVAFDSDGFKPAGYSDDPGLYFFVPLIIRGSHMDLRRSVSVFFGVPLILCFVLGTAGFVLLFATVAARLIAVAALCMLFAVVFHIGDIYLFEAAIPVLLIPWFLLLVRQARPSFAFFGFMFAAGLVLATASFIRTSAALPTSVFLCFASVWYLRTAARWRAALLVTLVVGMLIPTGLFLRVARQRDRFLLSHTAIQQADLERHTVWHLVYFGLGYLKLPSMPAECDEAAKAKVYSVDPSAPYLGSEYDRILREEVVHLFAHHPGAVIATLLGKAARTFGVALLFANIGLIAAWFYPKRIVLECIFACTLVVAAAPVILVTPLWQYLVGVISIATIYGMISLAHALQARATSRNLNQPNLTRHASFRNTGSKPRDQVFSA